MKGVFSILLVIACLTGYAQKTTNPAKESDKAQKVFENDVQKEKLIQAQRQADLDDFKRHYKVLTMGCAGKDSTLAQSMLSECREIMADEMDYWRKIEKEAKLDSLSPKFHRVQMFKKDYQIFRQRVLNACEVQDDVERVLDSMEWLVNFDK